MYHSHQYGAAKSYIMLRVHRIVAVFFNHFEYFLYSPPDVEAMNVRCPYCSFEIKVENISLNSGENG